MVPRQPDTRSEITVAHDNHLIFSTISLPPLVFVNPQIAFAYDKADFQ